MNAQAVSTARIRTGQLPGFFIAAPTYYRVQNSDLGSFTVLNKASVLNCICPQIAGLAPETPWFISSVTTKGKEGISDRSMFYPPPPFEWPDDSCLFLSEPYITYRNELEYTNINTKDGVCERLQARYPDNIPDLPQSHQHFSFMRVLIWTCYWKVKCSRCRWSTHC